MNLQLKQARSYFSDETSLALFDVYASAAQNDRGFFAMDFRPDLTQMKPRIKQDVTRAMTLEKPRKFVLYGGEGIAGKFWGQRRIFVLLRICSVISRSFPQSWTTIS
jgi:hypothetical protein